MKKLFCSFMVLVLLTGVESKNAQAQVRPFVSALTTTQQATLRNLMDSFITPTVVINHCGMNMTTAGMIHSDWDFLPFHRTYVESMEDYLILKGHPEFVPLPRWDPMTLFPDSMQGVDIACSHPSVKMMCDTFFCSDPINYNPNYSLAPYLDLPAIAGNYNDLCDWVMHPTFPVVDQVLDSGLSRIIEGDPGTGILAPPVGTFTNTSYHNNLHNVMGGVMVTYKSPSLYAFWNWHAYVDDIWKRWECNCANSTTNNKNVDLYFKDHKNYIVSERDRGNEPGDQNGIDHWISSDIWVDSSSTGGFSSDVHHNPEYGVIQPTYVYVRVRNRGCTATTGNEMIKLYWAKAGTYPAWPAPWDGSTVNTSMGAMVIGGIVDSTILANASNGSTMVTPGIIPAGGSAIIRFTWMVPNPNQFGPMDVVVPGSAGGWHFCLLARVVATNDADYATPTSTGNFAQDLLHNNNYTMKNVTVVNDDPFNIAGPGSGTIAIGNMDVVTKTLDFTFGIPQGANGNPITQDADVVLTLHQDTWDKWTAGGQQQEGLQIYREEEHQLLVTNTVAKLKNLLFQPHEISTLAVGFNFLTDQMNAQATYEYQVKQFDAATGEVMNGEDYLIKRNHTGRSAFAANAGYDQTITPNQSAQLQAISIGEAATYNWYDAAGKPIWSGITHTVSPEITTKYKLEVIAKADGYKDYDEVKVNVRKSYFTGLSPNPATTTLNIGYVLEGGTTSAYVMVVKPYGASNNYILDPLLQTASINVSNLAPGNYNVVLVRNGVASDVQTVVKQ